MKNFNRHFERLTKFLVPEPIEFLATLTPRQRGRNQKASVDEQESPDYLWGLHMWRERATENGPIDPSGRSGDRNVLSVITYNLR